MDLDLVAIQTHLETILKNILEWFTSPQFYAQCGLIFVAILLAYSIGKWLIRVSPLLREEPKQDSVLGFKIWLYRFKDLVVPLLIIIVLAIAAEVSVLVVEQSWLIRLFQGFVVLLTFYKLITNFIVSPLLKAFFKWTVMPVAVLHVFGWLEPAIKYLDAVDVNVGNIEFSIYGVLRTIFFGLILFWLGRVSNNFGQQLIRRQEEIDIGTREVFAKLFEIFLLVVIFFVLLQIMGFTGKTNNI